MKKQIIVSLIKIALLYLALPLLLVDLILIQTAVPRLIFNLQPFLYSSLFVLVIAVVISYVSKSKLPIILAVACLLYSIAFFASLSYSVILKVPFSAITLLIALTFLVGAINFLYRNKITEPLLALLPVCAGAWLFVSYIYYPSLVAWATYSAGRKNVASVLLGMFGDLSTNLLMMAIVVVPTMIMYFLGKHGYAKVYQYYIVKKNSQH